VRPELALAGEDDTLFLTNAGMAFSDNRMTQMVRNYVRAAGLGNIGSCHLFRHAMATQMLENEADVRFIQVMRGPGLYADEYPGVEGHSYGDAPCAAHTLDAKAYRRIRWDARDGGRPAGRTRR